jgi:AraC-like DNA-binding protein
LSTAPEFRPHGRLWTDVAGPFLYQSLTHNRASGEGGGIEDDGSRTIINSTITGNTNMHGWPDNWLLDTIGDIGGIGFDSAWRPPDLQKVATEREPMRKPRGLSARRLKAVLGYIREHLHAALTLRELAAVAHLSPYHFARRFKESTGLPPHRYVIARRIERAQQLLRGGDELSLAQVAARVGFWDQGHFTRHFKRLIGVTPKRFRCSASPCKNNPVRAACLRADAHDGAGTLERFFGQPAGISGDDLGRCVNEEGWILGTT